MMRQLLLTIICVFAALLPAHAGSLAQQADSAYTAEDYRQAIRLYHQAINTDGVSPSLYYNLANAYFRINNLGRAVLYYQRALNIDPSMDDARTNLEFVKTRIIDKPEDDSSFLGNLHDGIVAVMSPDAWAWVAFSLFALMIACIAAYIFSSNVTLRKVGFFGGIIVFFLFVYSSVVAYSASSAYYKTDMAVVTVPTTNMRTMPGTQDNDQDKVLPIHEGTLLQITDSVTIPGESASPLWYNVKINNSTRAWVNAADVERI